MKVLVHFDSKGEKALGIWWVDENETVQSLYQENSSSFAARGRLVVHNKANPEVSWLDWFDTLTNRAPYFEVWATYDSMGMAPEEFLAALQPSPLLA